MAASKKKANVIRAYTDKVDGKVHLKGEHVELTADRFAELNKGGFVEPVEVPKARSPKKGE